MKLEFSQRSFTQTRVSVYILKQNFYKIYQGIICFLRLLTSDDLYIATV